LKIRRTGLGTYFNPKNFKNKSMEKVIIIGGKGAAVVVAEQIYDAQNKHNYPIEFLGFAIDDEALGSEINGFPVLAKTREVYEKYLNYADVRFIFQLYKQSVLRERVELHKSLGIPDNRHCTFVHPTCTVSRSAQIGTGSVLLANTVVNPNAVIGKFCTIQSNAIIGHNAVLGDYNFIAAHAIVANIVMGERNFIGINATTKNDITIGDDCFIGMASNVTKSLPSGSKVYGNPAKPFDGAIKSF